MHLSKLKPLLNYRQSPWREVRTYTVVGTGIGIPVTVSKTIKVEAKQIIQDLINDFQIVFVLPAGNDDDPYLYGQIRDWP